MPWPLQVVWLLYWHCGPLEPAKQTHWPLPEIPSLQVPLPAQTCPLNVGHEAQFTPYRPTGHEAHWDVPALPNLRHTSWRKKIPQELLLISTVPAGQPPGSQAVVKSQDTCWTVHVAQLCGQAAFPGRLQLCASAGAGAPSIRTVAMIAAPPVATTQRPGSSPRSVDRVCREPGSRTRAPPMESRCCRVRCETRGTARRE